MDQSARVVNSRRCGLHALYLALKWLSLEDAILLPDFHELGRLFPNVETQGMNLQQIKDYLERKGVNCVSQSITKDRLDNLNEGGIVFALRVAKENSHIFLIRKKDKSGNVQLVDAPHNPVEKTTHEVGNENLFGLFVEANSSRMSLSSIIRNKYVFAFILLFLGIIVLFVSLLKWRKISNEK